MPKDSRVLKTEDIAYGIDFLESSIRALDSTLLDILLIDKTTRKNILWATTDYKVFGAGYEEFSEIRPELITGQHSTLIQPRITKTQNKQAGRTRKKAEVFTPSWICNKQNNFIDEQWFGRPDVFNIDEGITWTTISVPISFDGCKKSWKKYVDAQRLEISCGEAPYLVSRYDTVTGERVALGQRIGLIDRKMRIVQENACTDDEWLVWTQRAFESAYGYEYQGDNLLLARENLLYSYIEYYSAHFGAMPEIPLLRKIAHIISWNTWQMDGLKYVIPGSCKPQENPQITFFDYFDINAPFDGKIMCPGCANDNIHRHTGIYCKIQDWRFKCPRRFIDMMKGGNGNGNL